MASYDAGKPEVCEWIKAVFRKGSTALDVGACDGKYAELLSDHLIMDAVEIWRPNVHNHNLTSKYRTVIIGDIADVQYEWYDVIIFGDVIEHMSVDKARHVIQYAYGRCKDMIIGVPFKYVQGELYGNPYEKHIQDDLTDDIFRVRYSGLVPLIKAAPDYYYYHKFINVAWR